MTKKPDNTKTPVTLGFNIAVGLSLFAFLGYWLDLKWGTQPRWTVSLVFVGLFYGGYEVWKFIRENRDEENES